MVSVTEPEPSGPFTVVTCARGPPQISGTATVMYELLRFFPNGSFVLLTRKATPEMSKDDRALHGASYEVASLSASLWHPLVRIVLIPFTMLSILLCIRRLRRKVTNVLAVYPSLDFLIASLLMSRLLGARLFVHLHDCVVEATMGSADRAVSRVAERWMFSQSSRVYSMSDLMTSFYDRKGLKTEPLPHGVDPSLSRSHESLACSPKPKVGFAGLVYETNGSALKDLVDAKASSGGSFEIHVATPKVSVAYMRSMGILDSLDSVSTFSTRDELLTFLSSCDVLFVPMSFDPSFYKADLETIFPTKVTDYWLAGRPIIVYGPKDYTFVPKAQEDGYAVSVMERGPGKLLESIERICGSEELRSKLVRSSAAMIERHDHRRIAGRLMSDLGLPSEQG